MSSVVERRVSVCGEGGGPSTVLARECCVWGSSLAVQDMLPCAVRFLGRALNYVHWGVIYIFLVGTLT